MTKPKGISSRRRRRRKEEEVKVNLNVQEEDVDYYDDVGNLLFLRAMILQKGVRNTIGTGWLLLENQSIDDIFSNTWIAKDICHSWGRYIAIHCNSGKRRVMREETIKLYAQSGTTKWKSLISYTSEISGKSILSGMTLRGTDLWWWRWIGRYSSGRARQGCISTTCPTATFSLSTQ